MKQTPLRRKALLKTGVKQRKRHGKSTRTKALDISPRVKRRVWERDGEACVLCHSRRAAPNAHYINRSQGGLGIEQNIVTLCAACHDRMDNGADGSRLRRQVKEYLGKCYPGFSDEKRRYVK